ncbi:f-box domain protein [Fusarium subglutinans]|uniref:F-box domain protein n=1 Tax=Gibberella subglutinans TaxID=42677 RepID=A0A8H5QCC3_GIBSU|nr:f-box domain protein [Fusarium subglutinans]KAF5611393.1 f-box domain protein [Fusarium subglutinans]
MVSTNAATILDVCAYHRRDFDLVLIRSPPHESQVVRESIEKPFTTTPTVKLGALDVLPNELLNIILRNLDLLSYFRFRHVNRRARILASELQEYKAVVRHGIEGFRGMLRMRLATHFTFEDMYRALIGETCQFCKNFGGFLCLLTATRCCFACIENAPELRVISMSALSKLTKLSAKRLSCLAGYILRTVPGIYSMEERPARRPALLLAEVEATRRLSELGLLTSDAVQALEARSEQKNQRFMMSTAYPWYDPTTGQIEGGVSYRDDVFSSCGYQSHFETCNEAKALFNESAGGTKSVAEPEFTRRKGYFSTLDQNGLPK